MNKEKFKKWILGLRSDKYIQCYNLYRIEYPVESTVKHRCAIGVYIEENFDGDHFGEKYRKFTCCEEIPCFSEITRRNDKLKHSFDEIADFLEDYLEKYRE